MARHFDIGLLRTFVAVADHGGMTAAGNAVHLTQSAVSPQIARLEASIGRPLFVRDRQLRLTAAGEQMLGKARRLLRLNDEMWAEMTGAGPEGRVRLGVPYDLVGTLLAPILKGYVDAFPRVDVSLVAGASPDLAAALAGGELDLAVVEEPVGAARGECLAVDRLVWVGARGGSAYRKTPLPVSMVAPTCAFRPAVLTALGEDGREWRTVFENGSIDATTATVRADMAITTWLAGTVPVDLDILSAETGLPELPSFAISLRVGAGRQSAAAEALARHIRGLLGRPRQAA